MVNCFKCDRAVILVPIEDRMSKEPRVCVFCMLTEEMIPFSKTKTGVCLGYRNDDIAQNTTEQEIAQVMDTKE